MATRAANKRLAREYQIISKNPPPYIVAHPSESNILEWHYILTGPPATPYEGGQYWGVLRFPPDYPFAPPAILMHTPSGRFQPSTRLCLSISDFHPKSFNPAWEVSTILIGLLSFMTSEEMTTGSISATDRERKLFAQRSQWWNSTGGGSTPKTIPGISNSHASGFGNVKAGDGGAKFKAEWADLDEENWKYMKENHIDPRTGVVVPPIGSSAAASSSSSATASSPSSTSCAPGASALRKFGSSNNISAVMEGGTQAREASRFWISRHKFLSVIIVAVAYVVYARIMGFEVGA